MKRDELCKVIDGHLSKKDKPVEDILEKAIKGKKMEPMVKQTKENVNDDDNSSSDSDSDSSSDSASDSSSSSSDSSSSDEDAPPEKPPKNGKKFVAKKKQESDSDTD